MLEHGEIRNVGVAHADPETARLARRLHARRPVRAQASSGVSAALAHGPLAADPGRPGLARRAGDARRGAADAVARARRALVDRRPARGSRARVRRPHAGDHANPGGSSRSRISPSPRISRAAPRSRSRTRASTAPSTTSPTRCSRACCPARSRSRPGAEIAARYRPGRRGRRGGRRLLRHLADRRRTTSWRSATSPGTARLPPR